MWDIINSIIISIEILLILIFILGKVFKKKFSKSLIYIIAVFMVNISIYTIIYLQDIIVNKADHNHFIMTIDIILNSIKLFVGNFKYEEIKKMLPSNNLTMYSFGLGVILSISGTISVFVELFGSKIVNYIRVNNRLKKPNCDIILGANKESLSYALGSDSCIILVNKDFEKNEYISLIEKGYAILKADLNLKMLSTKRFNKQTNYNFISLKDGFSFFNLADLFIKYYNEFPNPCKLQLFQEVEEDKIATLKREIIEKQKCESFIEIFCQNDLLARDFVESNPITRHLPNSFIKEDTSIDPNKKINVFMVGFNSLNEKILKQYVINNQFVKFENNEYKNFLINYKVYLDEATYKNSTDLMMIEGIESSLYKLEKIKSKGLLPELPCSISTSFENVKSSNVVNEIVSFIEDKNSYNIIFIDINDDYENLDLSSSFKQKLAKFNNYHIYVRSDLDFIKNDEITTYYGDFKKLFNHNIIVNDELNTLAKKVNEEYFEEYYCKGDDSSYMLEHKTELALKIWNNSDNFTMNSNVSAALNLRVKLNLLGLDYINDGKGENTDLLKEVYQIKENYSYDEYFNESIRNALLAEEHARWNAYHLLNGYLPLDFDDILVKSQDDLKVYYINKNKVTKEHACLTTFNGLDNLTTYLVDMSSKILNKKIDKSAHDYYIADELLIKVAGKMLKEIGYSIIKKDKK